MARKRRAMTLFEFADAIDAKILITRVPKPSRMFFCEFRDGSIRVPSGFTKKSGEGRSPAEAIKRFALNIRGEKLVLDYHIPEKRQEFTVPDDLTA